MIYDAHNQASYKLTPGHQVFSCHYYFIVEQALGVGPSAPPPPP